VRVGGWGFGIDWIHSKSFVLIVGSSSHEAKWEGN